jgi:hypothetical protein
MEHIPPRVAALIPPSQLKATEDNISAYYEEIERLAAVIIPGIGETDHMKEHPAVLHYFAGGTDIYVCEWDGEDTLFGFTILNRDYEMAEFGYSSLSEIRSIPIMNLDYHWEVKSIELARHLRYPDYFKKP